MKNLVGFLLLFCLFQACDQSPSGLGLMSASKEASYYDEEEQTQPTSNTNLSPQDRKIIKTAEIRFQVDDLKKSTKNIEALTSQFSGFISDLNQTNSRYSINNAISVRIPVAQLEAFIAALEKESVFTEYTRIGSQDVTEEFMDVSTRLATKKEVRDRYIDILRNKAKTVKDILEAEEKIRVIQEEIESVEGRLKFLKDRTAMSTVRIQIYQKVEYVESPSIYDKPFMAKIKEGFVDGWNLIQVIAIGLVTIWPILLIILIVFLGRRKIKGWLKKTE